MFVANAGSTTSVDRELKLVDDPPTGAHGARSRWPCWLAHDLLGYAPSRSPMVECGGSIAGGAV